MTVGGGIRSVDDATHLLRCGADKVAVNTAAVENPKLISDIARRFGSQHSVAGAILLAVTAKASSELQALVIMSIAICRRAIPAWATSASRSAKAVRRYKGKGAHLGVPALKIDFENSTLDGKTRVASGSG